MHLWTIGNRDGTINTNIGSKVFFIDCKNFKRVLKSILFSFIFNYNYSPCWIFNKLILTLYIIHVSKMKNVLLVYIC
jgi:hypothetical protein